jgi:hypothetical protein
MTKGLFIAFMVAIACEIPALGAAIPRVLGQWPGIPTVVPQELTIGGNTLYAGDGRIAMYDISDVSQPRRVGTLGSLPKRIVAADRYALEFAGDYNTGPLRILDMSERGTPVEVARIGQNVISAAVAWPDVYVSDAGSLAVYDLSDPAAPAAVSGAVAPGDFMSLKINGNVLAAIKISVGNKGELRFFDISDRRQLVAKGFYGNGMYYTAPFEIAGDRAYVSFQSKLDIVDISNLQNPQKIGEWPGEEMFWYAITDMVAFPDTLWVSVANFGIQIVDVKNGAAPVEIKTLSDFAFTGHAKRGNDLFLAEYVDLKVYDVTNPADPHLKTTASFGGLYYGVTVTNNWAFVAIAHAPSRVLDITDPARPAARGPELPPGYSSILADNKLFLLDAQDRVNVFDITNPANPQFLSYFQNDDYGGFSMEVEGERLFLSGSNTVKVVNFANPLDLKLEKSIELPAGNVKFARTEDRLVVTTSYVSSYLSVIDISMPGDARLTGTLTNSGYLGSVAARNFAAYVDGNQGINVFQVVDAANPSFVKTVTASGGGSLSVDGDRLYVLGGESLSVLDISSPFDPQPITSLVGLPPNPFAVRAVGAVAYVSGGLGGLITVQVAGAAPTQPVIDVITEGEMHRVRWTRDFEGYTLLSAPTLSGPWTAEPLDFSPPGMFYDLTFGNRPGMQFYRLQK